MPVTKAKTSRINVRTTEAKRKRFARVCQRQDRVPADVVRRLIDDYTAGRISYTTQELQVS